MERPSANTWVAYTAFGLAFLCTSLCVFIYVSVSRAEDLSRRTHRILSEFVNIEESIRNSDYAAYRRNAAHLMSTSREHPSYAEIDKALEDLAGEWKLILEYEKQSRAVSLPSADPKVLQHALLLQSTLAGEKGRAMNRTLVAEMSLRSQRTEIATFIYERSRYLIILVLMLTILVAIIALQLRAQVASDRQLRASEAQYRGLFENVLEGVYQSDEQGRIHAANPALVRMLGFDSEDDLKRSALAGDFYTQPSLRAGLLKKLEDENGLRHAELELKRKDGTIITVLDNARPVFDGHGRVTYYLGTLTDITERKRSEIELAKARDAAVQASRMKSEFLANMSHEVRTPMNGIAGMTGMLLETKLSSEQREYAIAVQRSASYLLDVINDVLDLSKIEAGRLELERIAFPLRSCIGDVFDMVLDRAIEKEIDLICRIHPDVPEYVEGDPGRLRQILMNLVGNAVKFTSSGEVSVSVKPSPDGLNFQVTDTGIGICNELMEHIFEPFCQADGSITRKYGGTGLGLTISRRLVRLMQGEINVRSQPGQGSTFEFTVRFGMTDRSEAAANWANLHQTLHRRYLPPPSSVLSPHRILVAEDHAINQKVAKRMLERLGHQVDLVTNGFEALEALERGDYALVLMDCQMPDMDGFEATRQIRAREQAARRIPIVAMTAHAFQEDRDRCLECGMDDFLSKPMSFHDLQATLDRWLLHDTISAGYSGSLQATASPRT